MIKKISILSVLVLLFGFVSCKQDADIKYVSVPVAVSDGGSITESGTYTVYHFQQNVAGSLNPGDYTLYSTQSNQKLTAGTAIDSIKNDYAGFTAAAMMQNENAVYIYYNRNTITYTFNTGTEGTFDDGTTSRKVSGLYGAAVTKPSKTTVVPSNAEQYQFKKWTLADGTNVPGTFRAEDIDDIVAMWIDPSIVVPTPEGFVFVDGVEITGTETWIPSSSVFVSGRQITIRDLIVCDHEVTRGEYKEVVGSDPSTASAYNKDGNKLTGDDVLNNPVNYVNWYNALVYCNKLSINEGLTPCYTISGSTDPDAWGTVPTSSNSTWNAVVCDFDADGYRLPTEAEWEWLARGGENYTYAGSNTVEDVAWYTVNTSDTGTREVKTKQANGYGLYDMSGNVYEWCWDWYGSVSSSTADIGSSSGSYRVHRGGCWYSRSNYCMVADRDYYNPYVRDYYLGFRLVRSAQ